MTGDTSEIERVTLSDETRRIIREEVSTAISEWGNVALSDYATMEEVATRIEVSLRGIATEDYVRRFFREEFSKVLAEVDRKLTESINRHDRHLEDFRADVQKMIDDLVRQVESRVRDSMDSMESRVGRSMTTVDRLIESVQGNVEIYNQAITENRAAVHANAERLMGLDHRLAVNERIVDFDDTTRPGILQVITRTDQKLDEMAKNVQLLMLPITALRLALTTRKGFTALILIILLVVALIGAIPIGDVGQAILEYILE